MIHHKDSGSRLTDKDFGLKATKLTSVVNIGGRICEGFAAGSDRKIWHTKDMKNPAVDAGAVISQICLTSNQKALFAGVGEEGKPGAI